MLLRSLRTFRSSQWGRDTACRFCRFAQVFCSTRHNQSELCFCSCLSQKVLSVVRPKNDFNVFFTRSARQDTARRVPTYDENTQCECVLKMTVYSLAVCLKVAIGQDKKIHIVSVYSRFLSTDIFTRDPTLQLQSCKVGLSD